ncbi:hypothetical protein GCM10020331_051820 [Ectobacillus funiculus]
MGDILDEVLLHEGGQALVNKVENIRSIAKSLRDEHNPAVYAQLKEEITNLQPPLRQNVIRSFFYLLTACEYC